MIQSVNVGTLPNDGTGDLLRNAFIIINNNITELNTKDGLLDLDINDLNTAISNINASLALKADLVHTHVISDVIGLVTALNSKVDVSTYTADLLAINNSISNLLSRGISGLPDVQLTLPIKNGDILSYNLASSKWVNISKKWEGIDDVDSGSGVTGVTIETLDKTYHILPNVLRNGHLDFSLYSIREGQSLAHQIVVRVNNVNNFATATEIFRSTTGSNFSPHLRAQRKFTLKNNLIRNAFIVSNSDLVASATGVSVPFNLSGDIYIFFSTIPGATSQVIKYDSIQIKQL